MNLQNLFILVIFQNVITQSCFYEKNCASCVDDYCSKCYFSLFDITQKKCIEPDILIKNCYEYMNSDSIQCMNCKYGYGLNQYNQCHKCKVENCAKCDTDVLICDACSMGKLIDDKNQCSEKQENCGDQNCQVCIKNNVCLKCKQDYSFDKYLQCVQGLPNCDFLNPENDSRCQICRPGFHMDKKYQCTNKKDQEYSAFATAIFWGFIFIIFLLILYLIYTQINNFEFKSRRTSLDKYEKAMVN